MSGKQLDNSIKNVMSMPVKNDEQWILKKNKQKEIEPLLHASVPGVSSLTKGYSYPVTAWFGSKHTSIFSEPAKEISSQISS